jgi:hypothetical protein
MVLSDSSLSTLHGALIALLQQGELLLESLTDEQYRQTHPEVYSSGIGGHYRHTLDHISPLLSPPEDGVLDYDNRSRDAAVEQDRSVALERTIDLLAQAQKLSPASLIQPLQVRCSVSQDPVSPVVDSSLAREVMYAEIHAVHHYAIIRILCTLMEVALPETFGVAPSTLNHRETVQG